MMILEEYIEEAAKFADKSTKEKFYLDLGLMEEAGEVAGVFKKSIRDSKGVIDEGRKMKLLHELGDVCWYCAMILKTMNLDFYPEEEICFDIRKTQGLMALLTNMVFLASGEHKKNKLDYKTIRSILYDVEFIGEGFGLSMSNIFEANIKKLTKRKDENKIHGEGSNR